MTFTPVFCALPFRPLSRTRLISTKKYDARGLISHLRSICPRSFGCPMCAREPLYWLHCVQAVEAQRVDLVQSAVLDLQRHGFSAQPVLKQIVRDLLLVASDRDADAGCNGGVIAKSASRAGPPCMSPAATALAVRQCALVDGDLGHGCDEGMQLLRLGCFLVQCTSQTCTTNRFILDHALG